MNKLKKFIPPWWSVLILAIVVGYFIPKIIMRFYPKPGVVELPIPIVIEPVRKPTKLSPKRLASKEDQQTVTHLCKNASLRISKRQATTLTNLDVSILQSYCKGISQELNKQKQIAFR